MDCLKIGKIIRTIRTEKEMTQNELAKRLNISDKTISKWERGMGCPDITLLVELSTILEVDIGKMLKGDISPNTLVGGNMKNSKFLVCPSCNNVSINTGSPQISCCGRIVENKEAIKADENQKLIVERDDDEWYITSNHPSTKENYIAFIAYLIGGGMDFIKVYPEWDIHLRLKMKGRGLLVWYSTSEGFLYQHL